jgi:hypothetical protein
METRGPRETHRQADINTHTHLGLYNIVHCVTVLHSSVRCSAAQYNMIKILQYTVVQYSTVQYNTV